MAKSVYESGRQARTAAAKALKDGEFGQARELYEAAKKSLEEALRKARSEFIEKCLSNAERCKTAEDWRGCRDEVRKVLDCDPENATAQRLKAETEDHLGPIIRFIAKVGEREVGATATFDGKSITLPWTCDKKVKVGGLVPRLGEVEHREKNGRRYVGTADGFQRVMNIETNLVVVSLKYKKPEIGDTKTVDLPGGAKMAFVWCPPGGGKMGSPNADGHHLREEGLHTVKLTKGFWLGQCEVTREQWRSVMGEMPTMSFDGDDDHEDYPITKVSWANCRDFVNACNAAAKGAATFALPTEAQWEYACRAGSTGPYASPGKLAEMGWHRGNSHKTVHPVRRKASNVWGLYDMHGNVSEWCADWYDEGYYSRSPREDPPGPSSTGLRVCRGGNMLSDEWDCRSAARYGYKPDDLISDRLGFRLLRFAEPYENE